MKKKTFVFDKFIEDIVRREKEGLKEADQKPNEHPGRKYNELYQERWQNRVIWRQRNEK
jgi:IS4 transposase